jgi:CoA:oxalate CoA-transferase
MRKSNAQEMPLSDIRVIDMGQVIAGPVCAAFLADLGAEVIKVEPPNGGESYRGTRREMNGEEFSPPFELFNRNKRSLCLDLKSEEGRNVLYDLVADSDIFIQNFRLGTEQRLGIDYESLQEVNKDLIYTQITGYGLEGPLKDWPAFDALIQHMSGFSSLHGFEGDPPIHAQTYLVDFFAGYNAALSALAAVRHRERNDGGGQRVTVDMLNSLMHNLNGMFEFYNNLDEEPERAGTQGPFNDDTLLYGSAETKDGWIGVSFIPKYRNVYVGFCELADREDLLDDPRFNTHEERTKDENARRLTELFTDWLAEQPTDGVIAALNEHGIPAAPHNTIGEAAELDHVQDGDYFVDVPHPRLGEIELTNTPLSLSETPPEIRSHSPVLGEDNEEVLTELGYSADRIAELYDGGALREEDI